MKKYLFSMFWLCMISYTTRAVDFYNINIAWQYDPLSPVKMNHRVVTENGNTVVFLKLNTKDSLSYYELEYYIQENYESQLEKRIQPQVVVLDTTAHMGIFKIEVPTTNQQLFFIKLIHYDYTLYYDIPITLGSSLYPKLYPIGPDGLPILTNYLPGNSYQWSFENSPSVEQYKEDFPFADPPMADMKALVLNVAIDSSFVLTDSVTFKDYHFYVMQDDSSENSRVTFLQTPLYYPKYRKISELVESMLYLATESEKSRLFTTDNLKSSFDSFWLNTFGSRFLAKNAIRKYYNLVENANHYFTDFKQGWKTDRGMIYVVFGIPSEVYRQQNIEEWYYDDGFSFEFNIIPSFYTAKSYNLRRNQQLDELWFSQISRIRRGE